jgi:vacuolar fusion protein MON1
MGWGLSVWVRGWVRACQVLFGWMAPGFEVYAVFGPFFTKNNAVSAMNTLTRWIKQQEDTLFLLNAPVF